MNTSINILNNQIRVREDKYNLSDIIKSIDNKCNASYIASKIADDAKAKLPFKAKRGVRKSWAVNKSQFYKLVARTKTVKADQIWEYLMNNLDTPTAKIEYEPTVIHKQETTAEVKNPTLENELLPVVLQNLEAEGKEYKEYKDLSWPEKIEWREREIEKSENDLKQGIEENAEPRIIEDLQYIVDVNKKALERTKKRYETYKEARQYLDRKKYEKQAKEEYIKDCNARADESDRAGEIKEKQILQLQDKLKEYQRKLKRAAADMKKFNDKSIEYLKADADHMMYEHKIEQITDELTEAKTKHFVEVCNEASHNIYEEERKIKKPREKRKYKGDAEMGIYDVEVITESNTKQQWVKADGVEILIKKSKSKSKPRKKTIQI